MAQTITGSGVYTLFATNGPVPPLFYDADTGYWYLILIRYSAAVRWMSVQRTTDPSTAAWSEFIGIGVTTGTSADHQPNLCIIKDSSTASLYWAMLGVWSGYTFTAKLYRIDLSGSGSIGTPSTTFYTGTASSSGRVEFGYATLDQTSTHLYVLTAADIENVMGNKYNRSKWGKVSKANWSTDVPTLAEVGTTAEAGQLKSFGGSLTYTAGNYVHFLRKEGNMGYGMSTTRNHTSSDSVTQDFTTVINANYIFGQPNVASALVNALAPVSSTQWLIYAQGGAGYVFTISSGSVSGASASPSWTSRILNSTPALRYRDEVWALANYNLAPGTEPVATNIYKNGAWAGEQISPLANFDMPTNHQAFLAQDAKGLRAVSVVPASDVVFDATSVTTDWVSVVSDIPRRRFPRAILNF